MPSVRLPHVLIELERQVNNGQNLVSRVKVLGLPQVQLEIIAELAFLRVFMAWENFLEESFIRYLVGAASPSGYTPDRFVNPPNMEIAEKLILGEKREYVRWNSTNEVIARSKIYFKDGEPYKNALQVATIELDEMNTIRNRIAHKSTYSKDKFNQLIRRTFGHGIRGMTPGRFLLTPKNASSLTYFNNYVEIIKYTSRIILRV